jgi:tetratricopeptide (TPR) repeat protein
MTPANSRSTRWHERCLATALVLAAGTLGLYARSCANQFVNYDDLGYVTQNANVQAGLTWASVRWAFQSTEQANWHPLTWLSLQLDYQLTGLEPWAFHLSNVLLHVANTVILFAVFYRMTGALWRSALAAAMFAWHPLHVESVAWVAERKDVLSSLFWMLTMAAYVGYLERPGAGRYLLMVALYGLGLMAKPMLVTLPFVLLLLDYWPLRRTLEGGGSMVEDGGWRMEGKRSASGPPSIQHASPTTLHPPPFTFRLLLLEKLPLFALAAISCAVTLYAQGAGGAVSSLNQIRPLLRVENIIVGYAGYLEAMVWPTKLAPFYPLPMDLLPTEQVIAAAGLLACVSALAVGLWRRCPYLIVGWLWYLGTLVPVIGLVQVGLQSSADRYTYIPLIGIFMALSWGLGDLAGAVKQPRVVPALAAGVALSLCAVLTEVQLGYWHDSGTLWAHTIEATKNNYLAYNQLGYLLAKADNEEDNEQALQYFRKTLEINPSYPNANYNFGHALAREGRLQEAIEFYTRALEINPQYGQAHNNLGLALANVGRIPEAISHLRKALSIMPGFSMAHNNLGKLLAQQGETAEALLELRKAIELDSENAEAHANLAVLLERGGKPEEALQHYLTALRTQPNNADAHNNLGMMLARQAKLENSQEKRDEAIKHFSEAVRYSPKLAIAQYNLGVALAEQGKRAEAVEHYAEALRLEPANVQCRHNLGWELMRLGRWEDAEKQLSEAVRLKPDFALAHNTLGRAFAIQGKNEEALRSFQEAVRLEPQSGQFQCDLAHELLGQGDAKAAQMHYQEALERYPNWPQGFSATAWEFATHVDPQRRNGPLAVLLAQEACEATSYQNVQYLDALAAAYAEVGRFADAQNTARRALAIAAKNQSAAASDLQARLQLYERNEPFRQR